MIKTAKVWFFTYQNKNSNLKDEDYKYYSLPKLRAKKNYFCPNKFL